MNVCSTIDAKTYEPMTTDGLSVKQIHEAAVGPPNKPSLPAAGPSSALLPTYTINDHQFVIPENFKCKIVLNKTPILQICSQYKISYRLLCSDYNITPDPNFQYHSDEESNDESNSDEELSLDESPKLKECLNTPKNTRTRGRKPKKNCTTLPGKDNKRKTFEDTRTSKKAKLVVQNFPIQSVRSLSKKSISRSAPKAPSKTKCGKTKGSKPTVNNGFINSFEEFCQKSTVQTTTSKGKKTVTTGKRTVPFKAKDKYRPKKRRSVLNPNKCVLFLGEMFREMDLFDDYCDCLNDCEIDELSMAFDMLVRSKCDEELPKDLKHAIGSVVITDDEDSYDDVLPSESDVLHQVQQEAQLESQEDKDLDTNEEYVDAFLLNAGFGSGISFVAPNAPNINGSSAPDSSSAAVLPIAHSSDDTRTTTSAPQVTESVVHCSKLVSEAAINGTVPTVLKVNQSVAPLIVNGIDAN